MNKSEINNIKPINKNEQEKTCFCRKKQDINPVANVLLVDDDRESTRFILEILARKGIRGTIANDEKAAVDFLETGDYDLVFIGTETNQIRNYNVRSK